MDTELSAASIVNTFAPETTKAEVETMSPDIIPLLKDDVLSKPTYEEGVAYLKDIYTSTTWEDSTEAAQELADVAEALRLKHFREAKVEYGKELYKLNGILLSNTYDRQEKLDAIERWRETEKNGLYNADDFDKLLSAQVTEEEVDNLATSLRRDVVTKDIGQLHDFFARGLHAAISPVLGGLDLASKAATGEDPKGQKAFDEAMLEHMKPDKDTSISAKVAGLVGSVGGGITAMALSPFTGGASGITYLGTVALGQMKSAYDTVYEETGSEAQASIAMAESAPWIAVGTLADRIMLGPVGKAIKGVKGAKIPSLSLNENMFFGAFGNVVQEAGTRGSIAYETEKPEYVPTVGQLTEAGVLGAAGGAIITGAVKGIEKITTKAIVDNSINKFRENIIKNLEKKNIKETEATKNKSAEDLLKESEQELIQKESFVEEVKPEEIIPEEVKPEEIIPEEVKPEEITPEEITPEEITPEEIKPEEVKPEEVKPEEVKPEEIKPEEATEAGGIAETPLPSSDEYYFPSGYVPRPAINYLINKLFSLFPAVKTGIKSETSKGAAGEVATNIKKNSLAYALDRNLPALGDAETTSVAAHELGHIISKLSFLASKGLSKVSDLKIKELSDYIRRTPVLKKLVSLNDIVHTALKTPEIENILKDISAKWRPNKYWDAPEDGVNDNIINTVNKYRNRTDEIYADVMSAYLTHPNWLKENYSKVFDTIETAIKSNREVDSFLQDWKAMQTDDAKMLSFMQDLRNSSIKQHFKIEKQAIETAMAERYPGFGKTVSKYKKNVVNKLLNVRSTLRSKLSTEEDFKLYSQTYDDANKINYIDRNLNSPIRNWLTKIENLNIRNPENPSQPLSSDGLLRILDSYFANERIVNETNMTLEDIKSNPDIYKESFDILNYITSTLNDVDNPFAKLDLFNKDGQALADELAKLKYHFSTLDKGDVATIKARIKEVFDPNNTTYEPIRQRVIEMLGMDSSRIMELAGGKVEKIPPIKIIESIYDQSMGALMSPDALFSVRGYIHNPGGFDKSSAQQHMDILKKQLGADFNAFKEVADEFHDIIYLASADMLQKSGRLTSDMQEHIKLNKNNWVNFNILKYFADNPVFTAAIRAQIGTQAEAGSTIASTIAKTRAMMSAAARQSAENAIIKLASNLGIQMEPVKVKYRMSIFDQRELLAKKDPSNSYMIEANNGKYTLYKLADPSLSSIISKPEWMMSASKFLEATSEFYNKLTLQREFKTVLSYPYAIRQELSDRSLELSLIGTGAPGLWTRKTFSKLLNDITDNNLPIARDAVQGKIDPKYAFLLEQNAVPYKYPDEIGGMYQLSKSPENIILEKLAMETLPEEHGGLANKVNKAFNDLIDRIDFGPISAKKLKQRVEVGEILTKLNVFDILKQVHGMNDHEAAAYMREIAGTPDPLGGGQYAGLINKIMLFGRAHINGMRAMATRAEIAPKQFLLQYMYRSAVPTLMASSWFMAPLIGSIFGKEAQEVTKRVLDKIPTYHLFNKWNVPLGIIDAKGKFRLIDTLKPEDITIDTKTAYLAFPLERELQALNGLMRPVYDSLRKQVEYGEFSFSQLLESSTNASSAFLMGNVSPGIQTLAQGYDVLTGANPQDYFRNKGILSPDTQASGNMLQKTAEYLLWSLTNTAPNLFSYDMSIHKENAPKHEAEVASKIPLLGPTLKAVFSISNYGDYEKNVELDKRKEAIDSEVHNLFGEATKQLREEYQKSRHILDNERVKEDPTLRSNSEYMRATSLNRWNRNFYGDMRDAMLAAYEKGDKAEIKKLRELSETSSRALIDSLYATGKLD